jgi:hypothetical protein
MAFTSCEFVKQWPFLYHFTAIENLESIESSRELRSASELAKGSGTSLLPEKRKVARQVSVGTKSVWLQNQRPLYENNILFEGGWQIQHLIDRLNGLIFFWPGKDEGPSNYGTRHLGGNRWLTNVAAVRLCTSDLFDSDFAESLLFCPYNSGSPRCSGGKRSPRGPSTFPSAEKFQGTPATVVEVVVDGHFHLPASTEFFRTIEPTWSLARP